MPVFAEMLKPIGFYICKVTCVLAGYSMNTFRSSHFILGTTILKFIIIWKLIKFYTIIFVKSSVRLK